MIYNGTQINTVAMKEKILDILEKHYHGRNFIESRCADELLGLFDAVGRSEQLKCEHEPDRYTHKYARCKKCNMLLQMKR